MHARPIALFFLLLLLSSPLTFAVPNEESTASNSIESVSNESPTNESIAVDSLFPNAFPSPEIPPTEILPTEMVISFQTLPSGGSVCRLTSLTAEQVQRLRDNIRVPGIVGNEIGPGTPLNNSREKVADGNRLIVPNPDDTETAFQKEIPTSALSTEELSPLLNKTLHGAFAFGLSMDDTLRAARTIPDKPNEGWGQLAKLQYRNSGEGFSGVTKNLWDAVVNDSASPDPTFTSEERDLILGEAEVAQELASGDVNRVDVEILERNSNSNLPNHINVDYLFRAGILTNCGSGDCIITLYSMFDKYFNAWFSGELVVSTFGPTVWGQFKRLLVKSKRLNLITAKLNQSAYNLLHKNQFSRVKKAADKVAGIGKNDVFTPGNPIAPSEFFDRGITLGKRGQGESNPGLETLRNYKKFLSEESDFRTVSDEIFTGPNPIGIRSGGYSKAEGELFGPEGKLTKITDQEKRRKIYTYIGKVKQYADVSNIMNDQAQALLKKASGLNTLAEEAQRLGDTAGAIELLEKAKPYRLQSARMYAKTFRDFDDFLNLDMPDLSRLSPDLGFDQIYIKNSANEIRALTQADLKVYDEMIDSFAETGDFSKFTRAEKVSQGPLAGKAIQTYDLIVEKDLGIFSVAELQAGAYKNPQIRVKLNNGRVVPASLSELPTIQQDITAFGGRAPMLVKTGYEASAEPFTGQLFAERLLTEDVWPKKVGTFGRNMNTIFDTMTSRDWGRGRYTNILSKSLQSQEGLIKNYFNILNKDLLSTGIGWTGKTYGYWWLTRGFGNDRLSLYRLPKEFSTVEFVTKDPPVYEDAYVDFFANEGSDTGDLFQKVIQNLPIPLVLDEFITGEGVVANAWNTLNGGQGRTTPDNLAMYMFGPQTCANCTATLQRTGLNRFSTTYNSPEKYNAFFLEDQEKKESIEKGQLVMMYSHHTDVEGKYKGEPLGDLDLVQAREKGETCEQVIAKVPFYGGMSKLVGANKVGAVAATVESLGYAWFGLGGSFVTIANQLAIAPKMNECVDDKEGYYASIYVPSAANDTKKESKSDELQKSATDNALSGIRQLTETIQKENKSPTFTEKALTEAAGTVREFIDEQQKNTLAEAQLQLQGSSQGYIDSEKPIYFWMGGGSLLEASTYSTKGKTILTDGKGNTVTLDESTGTLTVNGVPIIDAANADNIRLANKNLAIPAIEIPQRLGGFVLDGDPNSLLLNINIRGEALVIDPALLQCIQQAVLDQSGVPLNSNNMSEAFGRTNTVVTDAYPNITLDPARNRIVMGGVASQTAQGTNASIQVFGDRRVSVIGAAEPAAGNLNSVLLEYGSLVYKPQTNELLIWLRSNAQAVVSDNDVKNFSGKLTNTKNEITSCDEPAIDLKVETDPNSALQRIKGENISAGLKKNGPFQVFDTDTKTIILYSKLIDGVCKPYLKVINKATGEVYDQEIKDIKQNEDGTIQITTADGKVNTLKISDENGKPVITLNGQSEILRSASGKGGSFYYDPNKGLYFAENAQFIPLNDDFKNRGLGFQANPDGSVSGKASDNIFNINTGQQGTQGLFNIPSLPTDMAGLAMIVIVLLLAITGIYLDTRRKTGTSIVK